MKEKILKLNQILNENFIKGNKYEISYNYKRKNFEIISFGKSLTKVRENLTAKEAINLIEFLLDTQEIER